MEELTPRILKAIIDAMSEEQLDMPISIAGEDDRVTQAASADILMDGSLMIYE